MARHSPCAPEALHLPLIIKCTLNVLSLKKKKTGRVVSGLTEPFSAVVGNPLAGFGTEERAHAAVQLIN